MTPEQRERIRLTLLDAYNEDLDLNDFNGLIDRQVLRLSVLIKDLIKSREEQTIDVTKTWGSLPIQITEYLPDGIIFMSKNTFNKAKADFTLANQLI